MPTSCICSLNRGWLLVVTLVAIFAAIELACSGESIRLVEKSQEFELRDSVEHPDTPPQLQGMALHKSREILTFRRAVVGRHAKIISRETKSSDRRPRNKVVQAVPVVIENFQQLVERLSLSNSQEFEADLIISSARNKLRHLEEAKNQDHDPTHYWRNKLRETEAFLRDQVLKGSTDEKETTERLNRVTAMYDEFYKAGVPEGYLRLPPSSDETVPVRRKAFVDIDKLLTRRQSEIWHRAISADVLPWPTSKISLAERDKLISELLSEIEDLIAQSKKWRESMSDLR